MTEQTNPIEVEATPTTQAVAVRPEQAVVNPLDLEPAMFKAGLDRRKENRKSLIDWVREALVEGVDFGRIPTKRGPSKPSLWKPGAEKICGMLGVTPTFPTLPEYEQAALKGIKIKSIVLRCEITNSSGVIIAHGVGGRDLEQDYGDLNKALKMAEKSAHIDATLRMAGLSEIFTQDLEDLHQAPPGSAPVQKPDRKPQTPANPAKASGKPQEASKPHPATETTREWFKKQVEAADATEEALQFMIELGWLMPNEGFGDMPLRFVPNTKAKLEAFFKHQRDWIKGDAVVAPYESDWDAEPNNPHAPKPRGTATTPTAAPTKSGSGESETTDGVEQNVPQTDAQSEPWYRVVVPIPHKGEKRDAYLKHPDTIGSLYEARHDDEEARKRLWGFVSHYEPKGWTKKNGQEMPPSQTDIKFREALDQFADFFERTHPDERL